MRRKVLGSIDTLSKCQRSFKRIAWQPFYHDIMISSKKTIKHYKTVGYSIFVKRQSAILVIHPITDYSNGFLFSLATLGLASDSMMTLT